MNCPHKLLSVTVLLIILLMLGLGCTARADETDRAQQMAQADALFDQAREALNRSRFEEAAQLFSRAFELSRPAAAAGDALYWEAFALARQERTEGLKRAVELLRLQQKEYRQAATSAEGEALAARIYAELAERGEADAAREVVEQAGEADLRTETRTAALQALMQMDPKRARPILTRILEDDSPANLELRRNALFIMCHTGGTQTQDLLIDMLQTETDPEFLSDIVMCLSTITSHQSRQAIMDLFRRTSDPQVAEAALLSIGHQGGDEVFDFLLQVATEKDRPVESRAQALLALSLTGRDSRVAEALIQVLETETDREILEMAMMSLTRLDDPAATKAISVILTRPDADEELKTMALHFAARNGAVDTAMLRSLYREATTRDLKQQVCHVLTMLDDEDAALDLLIEITRQETDPEIKRDAVFWIGRFDNEKAAAYLLEVINQE